MSLSSYGQYRHWEMLPGILLWSTFFFAIVCSFLFPIAVIIFIIIFDLYWLFRVTYFVIYLFISWREYRRCLRTNWFERLKELPDWKQITHLIFLPTYKERVDIIRSTLQVLSRVEYPHDQIIIVLGGEQKDHEHFQKNAQIIKKEFGKVFKQLIITEHPKDLPGEIPGKGSNLHYMAETVSKILNEKYPSLLPEQILVSSFDVDTVVHPSYFAYLTYLYLTSTPHSHASYQPVALFSNNIWSSPAPVRIAAFGTTFWLLTELARPERLWTFSSHSMSWKMLLDVGFWQKDIVSEDSRIFLQGLLHYHGNYRVIPMFLPVSMDAVAGGNYFQSLVALYKQQRRWAWGVEHLPVMIEAFRQDKQMPLRKKIRYIFNHIEGMYTWATAPILIFLLGWLPLWVAKGQDLALVHSAPFTLEWLMRLAMLGVFISGILSFTLLPARPKSIRASTWFIMFLQWLLLPITFILFGAFPAIDAQTRLMLGKYLGFNVTKKVR